MNCSPVLYRVRISSILWCSSNQIVIGDWKGQEPMALTRNGSQASYKKRPDNYLEDFEDGCCDIWSKAHNQLAVEYLIVAAMLQTKNRTC